MIKIDVFEIVIETEKAWNIKLLGGIYWLPKSQCRIVANWLYIPQWLADQNEMDYLDIDVE
jgi:hypothetical protein